MAAKYRSLLLPDEGDAGRALGRQGGKGWAAAAEDDAASDDDSEERPQVAEASPTLSWLGSRLVQSRGPHSTTGEILISDQKMSLRVQDEDQQGGAAERKAGTEREVDMEVTFTPGLDLGRQLYDKKRDQKSRQAETVWQAYERRRRCHRSQARCIFPISISSCAHIKQEVAFAVSSEGFTGLQREEAAGKGTGAAARLRRR